MERGAQRHRMNREQLIAGQFEHDHFEKVSGSVGPDRENLRRIGLRVEIGDDNGTVDGVLNVRVTDPVSSRGSVDLHTRIS